MQRVRGKCTEKESQVELAAIDGVIRFWSFFCPDLSEYISGGGLGGADDNEMRDDSSCSNSRKKEREGRREAQWCGGG